MEDKKRKCEKCNFECIYESQWNKHLDSELHKTGHKKKRSDCKEPFKCDLCSFTTKNKSVMKIHTLNTHADKETRKKEYKFYCDKCDFGTVSQNVYDSHLLTKKHKL